MFLFDMPGCSRTALSFLLVNVGVFGEATRLMLVRLRA